MTEIDPTATLRYFDAFLFQEGLSFTAVVIGGAALHILGIVSRTTAWSSRSPNRSFRQ